MEFPDAGLLNLCLVESVSYQPITVLTTHYYAYLEQQHFYPYAFFCDLNQVFDLFKTNKKATEYIELEFSNLGAGSDCRVRASSGLTQAAWVALDDRGGEGKLKQINCLGSKQEAFAASELKKAVNTLKSIDSKGKVYTSEDETRLLTAKDNLLGVVNFVQTDEEEQLQPFDLAFDSKTLNPTILSYIADFASRDDEVSLYTLEKENEDNKGSTLAVFKARSQTASTLSLVTSLDLDLTYVSCDVKLGKETGGSVALAMSFSSCKVFKDYINKASKLTDTKVPVAALCVSPELEVSLAYYKDNDVVASQQLIVDDVNVKLDMLLEEDKDTEAGSLCFFFDPRALDSALTKLGSRTPFALVLEESILSLQPIKDFESREVVYPEIILYQLLYNVVTESD